MLGGGLSHPAQNWPKTIGQITFFREHPYFLPCAVAGFIAFVSGLVALFGLKEVMSPLIYDVSSILTRGRLSHRPLHVERCGRTLNLLQELPTRTLTLPRAFLLPK
jgi:hypothetical protein